MIIIKTLTTLISLYQATISPDHGLVRGLFPSGVCRFSPTCSEYSKQALTIHGWRGLVPSLKRVARCHPFNPGGFDPVVNKANKITTY